MEQRIPKGTVIRYDEKQYVVTGIIEFKEDTFGYGKYLYIVEGDKTWNLYRHEFEVLTYPKKKTLVVSAYPCCGKTYAYEHQEELEIIDSDSSEFSWVKDSRGNNTTERNPEFPANYIEHIKNNIGLRDVIFVSSHLQVRKALEDAGVPFITVYPEKDLLNEWVGRMYLRGNKPSFIDFQVGHWSEFTENIETEPHGVALYRLGSNEYIDVEKLISLNNQDMKG